LKKQFACLVQGFPLGPGWLAAVAAALAGCGCWEDPGATAAGCPAGYLPPASGRLPAGWLAAAVGLGVSLLAAGWLAVGSVGWLAAAVGLGVSLLAAGWLAVGSVGWLGGLVWLLAVGSVGWAGWLAWPGWRAG